LAYLLVLPGSRARIVRCGGRYDPQLVKRSSEWVSEVRMPVFSCWSINQQASSCLDPDYIDTIIPLSLSCWDQMLTDVLTILLTSAQLLLTLTLTGCLHLHYQVFISAVFSFSACNDLRLNCYEICCVLCNFRALLINSVKNATLHSHQFIITLSLTSDIINKIEHQLIND